MSDDLEDLLVTLKKTNSAARAVALMALVAVLLSFSSIIAVYLSWDKRIAEIEQRRTAWDRSSTRADSHYHNYSSQPWWPLAMLRLKTQTEKEFTDEESK